MKKIIFLLALIICAIYSRPAHAQVNVSVNIGVQPVWGPVGYDHVDYYYLPDADAYYDVPGHVFVYMEGGAWVRRSALPPRYANFDFYHSYKVVINEREPWVRHNVYHDRYVTYRGRHDQVVIRDSREPRYYENAEHPHHNEYHPENRGGGEHRGEEHRGGGEHGGGHGHGGKD